MADIVNLNRIRKARIKAEDEARAQRNRIAHGRTKAEKDAARKASDKAAAELDGKKLTD